MYFGCCIYVLLLLNMPEMAHDWINKSILFYSILFCHKLGQQETATFGFKKDGGQTIMNYCSE